MSNFFAAGRRALPQCLVLATALVSLQGASQTPVTERWFQIEMVIFSQGNAAVGGQEQWRAEMDRGLRYPTNWVELLPPNQEPPNQEPPNQKLEPLEQESQETTTLGGADQITAEQPERIRHINLLSEDNFELKAEARQLARSNQYRVLFHGAWRQALHEQPEAPGILVQGGEQYGDHYELEGTVTISVSRYLHVNTNLWLTQFATNYGQQRPAWPDLPRRPNQPFDPSTSLYLNKGNAAWSGAVQFPSSNSALGEYNNILSSPYVIEHIAVMRETRKMYSKELHYLDHPLLGVLVKITPYQPPLLDADANTAVPAN